MTPHATLPASALLRRQFQRTHDQFDAALDQLTLQMALRGVLSPPVVASTCYAQAVLCEDLTIHGVLAAGTPLALSTWAGRTGLSELPVLATPIDWLAWAGRVQVGLVALRTYARAVYAATDAYLATLPSDARDETRSCILSGLLLTLAMRRGEIGRISVWNLEAAAGEKRQ